MTPLEESLSTGSGAAATPSSGRIAAARDSVYDPVMTAREVDVHYGDKHAVKHVSLDIGRNQVLAMIGPSGCGKSTFLRCLNRMNDTIAGARVDGTITLDGQDIYGKDQDVAQLRARVGIVFQKPTPFSAFHLCERGLRPAHSRPHQEPRRHGRARRHQPAARRPMG